MVLEVNCTFNCNILNIEDVTLKNLYTVYTLLMCFICWVHPEDLKTGFKNALEPDHVVGTAPESVFFIPLYV